VASSDPATYGAFSKDPGVDLSLRVTFRTLRSEARMTEVRIRASRAVPTVVPVGDRMRSKSYISAERAR
jgi:hypothetical protein